MKFKKTLLAFCLIMCIFFCVSSVAAGDVKTPAQAEVLYTEETAAEYNATLDGAVAVGDPVLYTQEEADAYNATLPGAVHAGDPIQ